MCGIAGFYSENIQNGHSLLHEMNQAMHHRGPDDAGVYIQDAVGLCMQRLSIIDLEHGHQPMHNRDKTLTIVFNGEIYNFQTLRQELESAGYSFRTASDTEVLLHLYEEYGFEMLDRLNGMFAFAIFDRRKDLIFAARDRMGEKPLHYYHHAGDFLFASEIKSLLRYPALNRDMSMDALQAYLTFEYVPAPQTIYQHVQKLLPGHYLIYKSGQITTHSYWQPSFEPKIVSVREEDIVDELEAHLSRAVEMRTVSDVPLGAFLSGGIDSSLITAFLQRHSAHKVKTFSIAFEEPSFDESRYARQVSEFLGTDHHEERLTPSMMLDILPQVLAGLDEPFADDSILPTYLLSRFTRDSVTVALSGDGGDELFSGYPTYQAHKVARRIPGFVAPVLQSMSGWLPVSDDNISFDFKMKRFAAGLPYKNPVRNQIWLGAFGPDQKKELLRSEIIEQTAGRDEFAGMKDCWASCDSSHYLDRLSALDLRYYLQDGMLVKVDRSSMANSLEVRVPFLDHELVRFVGSLRPELRLKGFKTKYILKKLAARMLPKNIVNRPKKGFGVPIAKWIKGDLREMFEEVLSPARIREGGFFNEEYVANLMKEHLSNRKDNRKLLWTLFVFESWRQRSQGQGG